MQDHLEKGDIQDHLGKEPELYKITFTVEGVRDIQDHLEKEQEIYKITCV